MTSKKRADENSLFTIPTLGRPKRLKKTEQIELPIVFTPMPADLDDKILEKFLNFIPLQGQVELRGVSSKWKCLLTSYFSKKHCLKLFTCTDDISPYLDGLFRANMEKDAYFKLTKAGTTSDDLIIKPIHWNVHSFAHMKNIFPNIKHLLIYIASDKTVSNQLHHLISRFLDLESLTILGKFNLTSDGHKQKFFNLINKEMHSLKRLDFRASDATMSEKHYEYFPGKYLLFYISPLVLAKLEHFSLVPCFQYYLPEVISSLGPQLKTLRLDRVAFTERTLKYLTMSFLQLNPSLLNTVTDLTLTALGNENDQHSLQIFQFICENFKQLEKFQFDLPRKSKVS